jgi:hypothetical protein
MSGAQKPGEAGTRAHEDADASPPAKKPYVKPTFVREGVFETTALACGKVNPTVRQCNLVRKTS